MAKLALGTCVLGAVLLAVCACGGSTTGGTSWVDAAAGSGGGGVGGSAGAATGGGTGGASGGGTGGYAGTGTGGFVNNMADKIDLLLMVDNSISMADKQEILAQAVPALVSRLVQPVVDPTTGKPELAPITDIHIGVITSSLGGHGGDQCNTNSPSFNPTQNDHARLIPSVRPIANLSSYQKLGFLWWDPSGQAASPPGEASSASLITSFAAHVKAAGETGCGYESSLEAWYRFLVDPSPPEDVVVSNNVATPTGVDAVVLQQRKDFLRPDSLVAIVMLTDENDCSTVDGGINWIAAQITNPNNQAFHLPRATAPCAKDPNGPCCRSCASSESAPPAGCGTIASDPECQKGQWDDVGDHPSLRCFDQKKRFGIEFLYPTRRYVEALTQPEICPVWDATGPVACDASTRVANPLFAPAGASTTRYPGLIFLAAIVGVPWQDIATPASLTGPSLEYLSGTELANMGRWDWLTPTCLETVTEPLPRPMPNLCKRWNLADSPDDAMMVESSKPRTGTALAINQPMAGPSAGYMANPINGHDWNTSEAELQYACIFQRATPLNCAAPGPLGCDCDDVVAGYTANNPLCQDGSGQYTTTQGYAKAYPGTRHLEVLRDFGPNAVVASICPKVTTGAATDPAHGYNPAVSALIRAIKTQLPPGT